MAPKLPYISVLVFILTTMTIVCAGAQNIERAEVKRMTAALKQAPNDTSRIILNLELGKFHIFKPGELKADLDSGEYFIHQAHLLSNASKNRHFQHECQIMEVVLALERGNEIDERRLFNETIAEFQKTHDKIAEASLRYRLAVWLTTRGTYLADVLRQYHIAATLYHNAGNIIKELDVLKEIASIHFDDGKVDLAESELIDILNRYKAIHYLYLQNTYNLLSTVARVKGNFNMSLKYAYLSIASMHTSKDTSFAANYYGDLARIYMEIGNNSEGIKWYKKALQIWRQKQRATFAVFITAGYISRDLISKGKKAEALSFNIKLAQELPPITDIQQACYAQNLADCFTSLHQYTRAEYYYKRCLSFYEKSRMDFENSQEANVAIGKFYLQERFYKAAGYYLLKALNYRPQKLSTATLKETHLLLFRVDSAQGNYLAAIEHYKIHKQLSDSILAVRKTREIEELQIKYETDKRIRDLAFLNNKNKLQQNTLQQVSTTQRYTIGVLILMLIISGLLLKQYKLKNRSNNDLKHQKQEISDKNLSLEKLLSEREWLLKEIHHRVKNNLQIVISLLNSQSSYLDNEIALDAIKESQHRMYSISLIHQLLYQSDSLALIDMPKYIFDLTTYLKESFNLTNKFRFELDISPIQMDLGQAIPVGLILNEAITNAIKYAFKDRTEGKVAISLKAKTPDLYVMMITDNGPGFPQGFSITNCQSLGMNLIVGLSTQLGGNFEFGQDKNTTALIITFLRQLPSDDTEFQHFPGPTPFIN